ncbi:MAG: hypothetical protein NZ949_05975 [Candidatus Kapabacteria bacterium]|nr:hypothetical protein [Candidatus Kapabacteria bacterium]MDW7996596.1 hypothetical protein [Bacteroidota bacterium]
MTWNEELRALLDDRRHGSTDLFQRFVELCDRMVTAGVSAEGLRKSAHQLAQAHPAMGLFWHLQQRFESLYRSNAVPQDFLEAAHTLVQRVRQHTEAAAHATAAHLPNGTTILTHSSSSHVRLVLQYASGLGKRFQLLCTVSEPGREGVQLARWAYAQGFPVTLLAEAQVGAFVPEIHLFLVGSDALCTDGVLHKIGTALLAYHLWLEHRPVWVVSCGEKAVPLRWSTELAGTAPRLCRWRLPQAQPLYDCTPWEYVSLLFTEQGMEDPTAFRNRFLGMHPAPLSEP